MVSKTLKALTTKISSLHEAAFWLAMFSVLSQVLAFLRDRLLAHYFGAGEALDIYYTAFRIPDFIFVTLGSLVSISVLVPMFSKKAIENKDEVKFYLNSIFTSFSVLIVAGSALVFVLMPQICGLLFRGFERDVLAEIIRFSRILLLSPILLGLSNFFGSIVQYEKRFILYSLSPVFYNVGIIAGTALGVGGFGVAAVVWGVVFGALLHLLVQVLYVAYSGNLPKFTNKINFAEVKETALTSVPRALALSMTQIVSIAFTSVSSFFGMGAIAVFNFSWNLQSVPLAIIGVSYSLAAFPTLSDHYAKKNIAECGRYIGESLRYIIFWTLPLSAVFIILRSHIVRSVLGSGAFDWADTLLTAATLSLFALSFVFQSAQLFLTRANYAMGHTKQPLLWGVVGALLTIALSIFFYFGFLSGVLLWIQRFLEVESIPASSIIILPIAFSLGAIFTTFGLWFSLERETKKIAKSGLLRATIEALSAALVIAGVTFWALRLFSGLFVLDSLMHVFGHALVSGLLGLTCGAVFLVLIKNREIKEILTKFK